jgi:hypothetical protein
MYTASDKECIRLQASVVAAESSLFNARTAVTTAENVLAHHQTLLDSHRGRLLTEKIGNIKIFCYGYLVCFIYFFLNYIHTTEPIHILLGDKTIKSSKL